MKRKVGFAFGSPCDRGILPTTKADNEGMQMRFLTLIVMRVGWAGYAFGRWRVRHVRGIPDANNRFIYGGALCRLSR